MKKSLFIVALAMVSFAACQKEIVPSENGGSVSAETVFTLSAVHEGVTTRTILDGTTVNWAAGDQIALIWNGGNAVSKGYDVTKENNFEFDTEPGEGNLFAVYPGDLSAVYDGSDFKVTIPAAQTGKFEDAAIEVAEVSEGASVAFKHLGSLLEVTVSDENVSKIVISAYGGEKLAGTVPVTFADGVPVAGDVTDGTSTVTLSVTGAGTYYASVLPGTYEQGFYVELRNNADQVIGNKIGGKTLVLKRRDLMGLGIIGAGVGKFVTVSGSGAHDGSTWDNAMAWTDVETEKGTVGLSGAYYLAGGIYSPNALDLGSGTFAMYGGFDPNSTGTDLSRRNTDTYVTAFDGGGNLRIMVWNNENLSTSFDGVTFRNASSSAANNVGSALILEKCFSAKFHNCKITGNTKSSKTINFGGTVRVNCDNISFTKCKFLNNSCTGYGGVFCIVKPITLVCEDCDFENNSAPYGGVMWCADNIRAEVKMKRCSFISNVSTSQGILTLGKSSGVYELIDCDFENNSAANGCLYCVGSSMVKMNRCHFEGNSTTTKFGAIVIGHESASLYANACSFYNNKNQNRGCAISCTIGNVAVFNCVFDNNTIETVTHPSIIMITSGNLLVANTSLRLSDSDANGIYVVGGSANAYLANNTLVHSSADEGYAAIGYANASGKIYSYGHNIYTDLQESVSISLPDGVSSSDLQATLDQTWNEDRYLLWNGTMPVGFVKASPSRVEKAIDDFDSAVSTDFKSWLGTLSANGGNALQTDIRGKSRNISTWWPGSYEN